LTQALGLSAEQQNKLHTVLLDRQVQTKGMAEQMRTLHTSLAAAVKSGDESLIDKASLDIANLHQQQTAIHAKSVAKIYAALTPAQKTKVGANLEMLMGPAGPGPRRRNRPQPSPPAQQ
jgi:Spy/CpxP family protein refolding chaperone